MPKRRDNVESRFVPAAEAGKVFGYTRDYISKLARENKIEGKRIGRGWHVTIESVEKFKKQVEQEKKQRGEAVRKVRKQEQKTFERHVSRERSNKIAAALEAVVVLVLGLSIGMGGYVATDSRTQEAALYDGGVGSLKEFAMSFYRFISGKNTDVEVVEETKGTINKEIVKRSQEDVSGSGVAPTTSVLFVTPEENHEEYVASIKRSFSDEVTVEVDPDDPETGIVTPIFRDRVGDEYRFLMFPIAGSNGRGG